MRLNCSIHRRKASTLTKPTIKPHPNSPQLPSQAAEGFRGVKTYQHPITKSKRRIRQTTTNHDNIRTQALPRIIQDNRLVRKDSH